MLFLTFLKQTHKKTFLFMKTVWDIMPNMLKNRFCTVALCTVMLFALKFGRMLSLKNTIIGGWRKGKGWLLRNEGPNLDSFLFTQCLTSSVQGDPHMNPQCIVFLQTRSFVSCSHALYRQPPPLSTLEFWMQIKQYLCLRSSRNAKSPWNLQPIQMQHNRRYQLLS